MRKAMICLKCLMFEGSGFQATYNVPAKKPAETKPGQWYFGFDCPVCHARFAVWDDPGAGAQPFTSKRPCVFKVSCAHCAADRLYRTDQVRQYKYVP
jgi:hypothetical protein